MLAGTEPRGLPGTAIDRFAILEVQVERSIAFASADRASRRPDFWTSRYELAIATVRTSRRIEGAYKDVLTWARHLGDAATSWCGSITRKSRYCVTLDGHPRTMRNPASRSPLEPPATPLLCLGRPRHQPPAGGGVGAVLARAQVTSRSVAAVQHFLVARVGITLRPRPALTQASISR